MFTDEISHLSDRETAKRAREAGSTKLEWFPAAFVVLTEDVFEVEEDGEEGFFLWSGWCTCVAF